MLSPVLAILSRVNPIILQRKRSLLCIARSLYLLKSSVFKWSFQKQDVYRNQLSGAWKHTLLSLHVSLIPAVWLLRDCHMNQVQNLVGDFKRWLICFHRCLLTYSLSYSFTCSHYIILSTAAQSRHWKFKDCLNPIIKLNFYMIITCGQFFDHKAVGFPALS